ncbi:hypothetical protein AWU68_1225 [Corynebacterium simulans]|nr:hypothetical protein AWU68_1225 [Corynebacterium simulans]
MYPSAEDVVDGDNEGIKSVHEVLLSVVAAQMQGGGKETCWWGWFPASKLHSL